MMLPRVAADRFPPIWPVAERGRVEFRIFVGAMKKIDPVLQPIIDMLGAVIQTPKVYLMLKNWEKSISTGMLNFGTTEKLDGHFDFNVLFLLHPNPKLASDDRKIILDPEYEIAGVVSNDEIEHRKDFNYLKTEVLVVKAFGKWDFAKNKKFRSIRIQDSVLLNMPEYADPNFEANAMDFTKDISKMCKMWLLNNRLKGGGPKKSVS